MIRHPRPLAVAALCTGLLWFWQFLTVRFNYDGKWSGLFCIGSKYGLPEPLRAEAPHIFRDSWGYDGQSYHTIAHDPWLKRGFERSLDSPAFRYRRILIPALAWGFALGRDDYVDFAYFALILGFALLGAYWLACFAAENGCSAWWGLGFAATPATLTSIDRMTVDIALAAFSVGFALLALRGSWIALGPLLAAAALSRETGMILAGGAVLASLLERRLARAVALACTVLPAIAWYAYVHSRTSGASPAVVLGSVPFAGLVRRLFHPEAYANLESYKWWVTTALDYISLAGVFIALALVIVLIRKRRRDPAAIAIYALSAGVAFLGSPEVWTNAYAFGRALTPLFVLLAIEAFRRRQLIWALPMALVSLRVAMNLGPQAIGILKGIAG